MAKFIDKKSAWILTYASTWDDTLNLGLIKEHFDKIIEQKNLKVKFICCAKEEEDEEIKRDHFHCYWELKETFSCGSTLFDVPLKEPVYSFYKEESRNDVFITIKESTLVRDYGIITNKKLKKIIEDLKCTKARKITVAHPNIKVRKHYGSLFDMLNYVSKKRLAMWCTGNLDKYLKDLLLIKNKNIYKINKKEPNWSELYHDGWSLQEVLELLKNKYTNQFIRNYYKWSAGINAVFCRRNEDVVFNGDLGFWIPNKLLGWIEEIKEYLINFNNKKWIKRNRHNRPKSLIWFGSSKRGKTTFINQFFYGIINYYQFLFDGMESFDENKIIVCLDDFNIDLNHFLPGWKCWLGAQTGFSINPKFGRRRKLNWGHPCVFLSNKSIGSLLNNLDKEEEEYIKENCVIVETGKRKLWEKPNNLEELVTSRFITIAELRQKYNLPVIFEDPNASDIDREEQENEPVLINENGKRKLGRLMLPTLKRRTGSGFFY